VVDSTSNSDSQLLLGSIIGLKMAPHTVTLVNSGVTGDILDIDHVEVESVVTAERCGTPSLRRPTTYRNISFSSSLSAKTFDDTIDVIQWGPGWVYAPGPSTFYNSTIQYVLPRIPSASLS